MKNLRYLAPLGVTAASVLTLSACGGGGGSSDDNQVGVPLPDGRIGMVSDQDTAMANAINGITYSADGSSIYAVGYFNDSDGDGDRKSVLLKYDAMGNPDQSFGGGDGVMMYNFSAVPEVVPAAVTATSADGDEQPYGIVELSDGDLLMLVNADEGNATDTRAEGEGVYLVRLNSDGSVDSTWGDEGSVEVVFGWDNGTDNGSFPAAGEQPEDFGYDLLLDNSGDAERVVINGFGPAAAGTAGNPTDRDRYVTRILTSDGSVDPAFNSGGAFTYSTPRDTGTEDNARRAFVTDDGTIMSAGYTDLGAGFGNHVILIQLTPAGVPDPEFGNYIEPAQGALAGVAQDGVAVFNPFRDDGGFAEAYGAVPQSSGDYVTTGYGAATAPDVTSPLGYATTEAPDLVTFRATAAGTDVSFGNPNAPGTQAIQSEPTGATDTEERGRDMIVLPDDRIVHVGRFAGESAIYVFAADGQLDTSVDGDGIALFPHTPVNTAEPVTQQFFTVEKAPDESGFAVGTRGNDEAGARLLVFSVSDS